VTPERIVAVLCAVATLCTGAAALWQARTSRQAGVSGDEREARRDEAAQRRDAVTGYGELVDQLQEQMTVLSDAKVLERIVALERRLISTLEYTGELERHVLILEGIINRREPPPPPARPVRPADI
jgi:hypothetical protein